MIPNGDNGTATAGNGQPICSCGATEYSAKSLKRCAKGHVLLGNQEAAITGEHGAQFWREHNEEIDASAGELARDAGYTSLSAAPLTFRIAAIGLARTSKVADLAYVKMIESGGPISESGRPRRAYSIWAETNRDLARDLKGTLSEIVAARPPGAAGSNSYITAFESMSEGEQDAEVEDIYRRWFELRAARESIANSRIGSGPIGAALPTRVTSPTNSPAFSRPSQQPIPNSGATPANTQNPPSNSGLSSAIPPPVGGTRTSAPSLPPSRDTASAPAEPSQPESAPPAAAREALTDLRHSLRGSY